MGGGAVDTTTGAFSIISFCRLSLLSSRDERSDERRCEIFLFESNESNNESSSRTSRQPADVDQSDHQITLRTFKIDVFIERISFDEMQLSFSLLSAFCLEEERRAVRHKFRNHC